MQPPLDETDWRYQGWRVLWASTGAVFFSFSSVLVYSFGVFLKPISAEFHWSREAVSLAFGLAALCVALTSPFLGVMLDRMAPSRTILPCFAVFGISFASLSLVTPHLWHLYSVYVVLGLVGNGTAQLAYSGAVATWFKRRRGLAFAILLGGSALGATIWPIVVQGLISHTSWRAAYAVMGCMILAFALPLGAQVKRRPDSAVAVHNEDKAVAGLSSLAFWMIVIILFAASLGQNGALAHMAALLTDRGVAPAVAASAISVLGGCTLIGRVATGWLLDRFFAPYVSFGLLAIASAGITLLSQAHSASSGLVAAALIGLGMGGEGDITPYLLSRYFSLKSFSTLYGFTWSAYAVAGAVGPVIMGRAFDHTGSYDRLLMKLSALTLGTALLSLALPRYHEPATAEVVPDLEVQVMDRG